MPTTSVSLNSRWCTQVYKLPSNAVDRIPLDIVLEFNPCSPFRFEGDSRGLPKCVQSVDGSANIDITFPVRPFQTCKVPSQDAILSLVDMTHMSFTT